LDGDLKAGGGLAVGVCGVEGVGGGSGGRNRDGVAADGAYGRGDDYVVGAGDLPVQTYGGAAGDACGRCTEVGDYRISTGGEVGVGV